MVGTAKLVVNAVDLGACIGINSHCNRLSRSATGLRVDTALDGKGRAWLYPSKDLLGSSIGVVVCYLSFPKLSSESDGSKHWSSALWLSSGPTFCTLAAVTVAAAVDRCRQLR